MARIDPSPARWKHGDVVKRLLICRCNFYDNGDGRALMWVIWTSPAFERRVRVLCTGQGSIGPHFSEIMGLGASGAQERTRTFTAVKPLAPEASASTNSATWARAG
jgi:hypothetical protein